MVVLFAVRQAEEWTAGSVASGILLAGLALAALIWAIDRASRS